MNANISTGDCKSAGRNSELVGLRTKLARLVADDLEAIIDFEMPARAGSTKAAEVHRKRTAQYKSEQLRSLAPDSQAIAQACSFLVLRLLSSQSRVAPELLDRVVHILAGAGYERGQIEVTVNRLLVDLETRETRWQRSQVRRLSTALAASIRGLK